MYWAFSVSASNKENSGDGCHFWLNLAQLSPPLILLIKGMISCRQDEGKMFLLKRNVAGSVPWFFFSSKAKPMANQQ